MRTNFRPFWLSDFRSLSHRKRRFIPNRNRHRPYYNWRHRNSKPDCYFFDRRWWDRSTQFRKWY